MTTLEERESLSRQLSSPQLAMMAIGGAIGTGLFLGSALAVRVAGPGVILTYLIGAFIAVLLMRALGEMAVAHPTAGSFGVYAELYLNKWAGFTVRYTYWAGQCVAIGGEATAIAIYCQWWFPNTPQWLWILVFTIALLYVNARSVGSFGAFEYWFAMIKVVAIVLFVAIGAALIFGLVPHHPATGFANLTEHGGFLPNGLRGVWLSIVFVIFSYIGTEVVAVTAGEAKNPEIALPRAMRTVAVRLLLFYVAAIFVLVTVVPWTQIQLGASVTASPFVRVFQLIGIPAAAHIVNFVVVTAAASSMNCNLYLVSRMMYSLACAGYAPASFGRVSKRGVPVTALLISAAGLSLAMLDFDSVAVKRIRLFVWCLTFRWPLRLAHHLRYSRLLSHSVSQTYRLVRRCRLDRRHSAHHMVGRRNAHHSDRRLFLARRSLGYVRACEPSREIY
jgi:AAT family amino acid transporter